MENYEQRVLQPDRKLFSRIGLACFAVLFIASVLQLAAHYLILYYVPVWTERSWYVWAVTFIPSYGVAVPIGILLFLRIPAENAAPRNLRFKDLLIFFIMCFPIMYIGQIIGSLANTALHMLLGTQIKNSLDIFINSGNIWLTVLFMVILAPVIEELIFRKLIIDRMRSYGEGACVLVSALLFGLFHGNLSQFFYAFGLGAIFAFIYVKTGRLRYTIFLHMAINFYGGVVSPLLMKGVEVDALTIAGDNPQAMMRWLAAHLPQLIAIIVYAIIGLALVIAGLVLLIVRRKAFFVERGPLQPARGTGFRLLFLNVGMALFAAAALGLFVLSLI